MSPLLGGADVGLSPQAQRLRAAINSELAIPNAVPLGSRADGATVYLRFFARTPWVQVHVQSTEVGGGGFSYAPDHYVSSEEVDCRESRQQDVTLPELENGRYIVYLVPVEYDAAGTKILYDGIDDRPDYMSFVDIGSIASSFTTAEKWSVLYMGRPGHPPLPDGTLDEGDQAALSGLFAGIDY